MLESIEIFYDIEESRITVRVGDVSKHIYICGNTNPQGDVELCKLLTIQLNEALSEL